MFTLEEKCMLVTGSGMWHTKEIEGKIKSARLSDGPHGVRCQNDGSKNNDSFEATCFPTASVVACSWDRELLQKMGSAIADEAKELGLAVLLGPGVNIKRSPLCGRNFEYYSEDPYLAGELAGSFINGVQSKGIGTSIKHFAGNNQETHRMLQNSMIDERALREIYLTAFEKAIKIANPATVMASYNRVNGEHACENKHLLTEILRDEWGYEGLVMSDWGACARLPICIDAGLDLEMPDSFLNHYNKLLDAVKSGEISEEALDQAVARVVAMVHKYANETDTVKDKKVDEKTRRRNHLLAGKIATESAVLLKNDNFFPIKPGSKVLVVGELAEKVRFQGGGSSHINTKHVSSALKSLVKCGLEVKYLKGYKQDELNRNIVLEKAAVDAVIKARESGIPVLFFGGLTDRTEGEGYDRDSYILPENQRKLLSKLLKVNSNVGFISFGGSPYDMSQAVKAKGILQMYLAGEMSGAACAKLVTGKANPCGKLAETFPLSLEDVPSYGHFGRQEKQAEHVNDVFYLESIFVGYRYYDTYGKKVRFPFGHGLSYTKFEYSNLKIEKSEDESKVTVSFAIKNVGDVFGKEIAQVYVKNPKTEILRANKELKGFVKVELKPGESKTVSVTLDDRAFSLFVDKTMKTDKEGFVKVSGVYEICVGASVADIRLKDSVVVSGEMITAAVSIENKIPLSMEEFEKIYDYEIKDFTNIKPGGYTVKNSLNELAKTSLEAKIVLNIAKLTVRKIMFPKTMKDPDFRMMYECAIDGPVDGVVNQSRGAMKYETIERLVDKANKKL